MECFIGVFLYKKSPGIFIINLRPGAGSARKELNLGTIRIFGKIIPAPARNQTEYAMNAKQIYQN